MSRPLPEEPGHRDPRLYMAAERTFLAWLRTGSALMVFGFVIGRLPLVLHEVAIARGDPVAEDLGFAEFLGAILIALGIAMNVAAAFRHWGYIRAIREGRMTVYGPRSAFIVAGFLALIGLTIIYYLLIH